MLSTTSYSPAPSGIDTGRVSSPIGDSSSIGVNAELNVYAHMFLAKVMHVMGYNSSMIVLVNGQQHKQLDQEEDHWIANQQRQAVNTMNQPSYPPGRLSTYVSVELHSLCSSFMNE